MVTCPLHCGPGATVRIDVPAAAPQHPTPAPTPPAPQTSRAMQVTVPAGVVAGQSFRVQIAGGGDVMVACPPNCGPGSALRIEVPITQPAAEALFFESWKRSDALLSKARKRATTTSTRSPSLSFPSIQPPSLSAGPHAAAGGPPPGGSYTLASYVPGWSGPYMVQQNTGQMFAGNTHSRSSSPVMEILQQFDDSEDLTELRQEVKRLKRQERNTALRSHLQQQQPQQLYQQQQLMHQPHP